MSVYKDEVNRLFFDLRNIIYPKEQLNLQNHVVLLFCFLKSQLPLITFNIMVNYLSFLFDLMSLGCIKCKNCFEV